MKRPNSRGYQVYEIVGVCKMSIRNMQVKTHKSINKIEKIVNMLRVLYGVDYTGIIVYDMLMILTNKKKKHCVYFLKHVTAKKLNFMI